MKVYVDEDLGKAIPEAIRSVKIPNTIVEYPRKSSHAQWSLGTPDKEWLPWAGDNGYVVISENHHIVENEEEFALLVSHNVKAIFVMGAQQKAWEILRLLLVKWDWIRRVDAEPGPCIWLLYLSGRARRYDHEKGAMRLYPDRRLPSTKRRRIVLD